MGRSGAAVWQCEGQVGLRSCRWSRGPEREGRQRTVTVKASTNMLGLVCPQASGLKASLTVYTLELSPHPRLEDSPMGIFIWNSSVQNSNQGCSGEIVGTSLWPPGLPSRSSQEPGMECEGTLGCVRASGDAGYTH